MEKSFNKKTYAQATKSQKGANKLSLFEQTIKPVKDYKLPYGNERETEGDGNCWYNAIIDQIQNNPRVFETISEDAKKCSTPFELRTAVIEFMKIRLCSGKNQFWISGKKTRPRNSWLKEAFHQSGMWNKYG